MVYGKDRASHDANLDRLMTRCREKCIKLNPDKTEVGKTEITFFGHCLTSDGFKVDPQKVNALKEMLAPTSRDSFRHDYVSAEICTKHGRTDKPIKATPVR